MAYYFIVIYCMLYCVIHIILQLYSTIPPSPVTLQYIILFDSIKVFLLGEIMSSLVSFWLSFGQSTDLSEFGIREVVAEQSVPIVNYQCTTVHQEIHYLFEVLQCLMYLKNIVLDHCLSTK